jgi:hypothetical protein
VTLGVSGHEIRRNGQIRIHQNDDVPIRAVQGIVTRLGETPSVSRLPYIAKPNIERSRGGLDEAQRILMRSIVAYDDLPLSFVVLLRQQVQEKLESGVLIVNSDNHTDIAGLHTFHRE